MLPWATISTPVMPSTTGCCSPTSPPSSASTCTTPTTTTKKRAKKAMEYLKASMYKDRLANAGLYYAQLVDRSKVLKALNTPTLGDSLLKPDGTPWMADLGKMAPKINWDDLTQTAALPLGSWLKVDPWDDSVHMLDAKRYAPMNARDKMPFEVTPVFYKLQRYEAAHAAPPPPPPAPAPASGTPQSDGQPATGQGQDNTRPVGKPVNARMSTPTGDPQTMAAVENAE